MRMVLGAVMAVVTGVVLAGTASAGTQTTTQELFGPYPTQQACNDDRVNYHDTQPCFYGDPTGPLRPLAWYFWAPLQPR
ncbi:hypothetical protein [Labedaea rhizosphaerae]|uniref:Secreted protein n=1 Tax=Labedaea rhizosphaerae TaxID=598644 RepID=A0A4R6SH31_LABRH|nr:hypothetical protein [Labedaea rhizosphaerae]TDQ01084.1 hypothetical protein EV186_102951 [Labedaea rhizosphaerae]